MYYSQRYQAAIFDPSYSEAQIVEVAVKRFHKLDSGETTHFEACVSGSKDIVFNRPDNFKVNLVPLFETESEVPDRYDAALFLTNFHIVGTQLQLYHENEDEEIDESIPLTLTYNLPNPKTLAPLAAEGVEHESFTSRNEFTYSRLQEVRDGNSAIIAETWLKGELVQMSNKKLLNDNEMLRLIKNANLVTMN